MGRGRGGGGGGGGTGVGGGGRPAWAAGASRTSPIISRPWRRSERAVVVKREAKREPRALWVPKLPLRHNTAGRSIHSAGFEVGSTPS